MRPWFLIVLVLLGAACPKRFDPSSEPAFPTKGNKSARDRFMAARAQFERDQYEQAGTEMESIRREFPDDPIAPYAALYEGMAQHRAAEYEKAAAALAPIAEDPRVDEGVRKRARFFLGLAESYLGRNAEAIALLTPFASEKLEDGEDKGELHAALAESTAASGDAAGALRWFDELWGEARPAERAWIVARVRVLVDGLADDAARQVYTRLDKGKVSAALLGRRVAALARAAGDAGRAQEILDETAAARQAAGIASAGPVGNADVELVGAVVALSGRRRLVGEVVLRGLALAAGTYDRTPGLGVTQEGIPRPFEITARDAGDDAAAQRVDELAVEGAIAIIGPTGAKDAAEASRRATDLGVPIVMLDLSEDATESPYVFRIIVSADERARALAQAAYARGARKFAMLVPTMPYGAKAAAAFRQEVEKLGGAIVVEVPYDRTATSFVKEVKKLGKQSFDALFVPDQAAKLELIAPQLAVDNLIVQPPGAKKPRRGKAIQLLSTAEGLSPRFLKGSGRYAHGALFAPGFYADEADARIGPFVARYRAAYGDSPSALEAYAYDAALLVRAAIEKGARSRDEVAASLAGFTRPLAGVGLTGDIAFDATRGRADRGLLYTVEPDGEGGFAIHAVRTKSQ
jgi:ABC-type branched-subunit amino acid transport system substrate-binding protein